MLFHPARQALFVADSGNHRIQIFDAHTFQLVDIWGQPGQPANAEPGSEPGLFNTPWSIANDSQGFVYVVDYGNQRVQKFDVRGNVSRAFWDTIRAYTIQAKVTIQPSDVAVDTVGQSTEVYILDASARTVFVFDPAGQYIRHFTTQHPADDTEQNSFQVGQQPMGLVVRGATVYIGDNGQRRLLQFTSDGAFVGEAWGYEGPVAALAIDRHGDILVHTGAALAPVRLAAVGAYGRSGGLWGGPFHNTSAHREQWHWLRAMIEPLSPGAHTQLYVYDFVPPQDNGTRTPPDPKTIEPPVDTTAADPFADPRWKRISLAPDISETLFPGAPLDYVWIGLAFSGDGRTSPVLAQMRLDFDYQTYLQYLPTIYQEDALSRQFLARFLSLFASRFDDLEARIASLATLFDPAATQPQFLSWLAGWLALEFSEDWDEAQRRQAIIRAFASYGQSGTVEGLQLALRNDVGVDVYIEEPILQTAWWALPTDENPAPLEAHNSILGFTTVLTVGEPQAAVVGTTAVLDQSYLITQEDFGTPLFDDVAHQFSVQLYQGRSYSETQRDAVRTLLDREKPAHTTYHLCVLEPRMRVGFQARIGIDSIVAGPLPSTLLVQTPTTGTDLVLGGEPAGRIGERSQLGRTTRLTDKAVEA